MIYDQQQEQSPKEYCPNDISNNSFQFAGLGLVMRLIYIYF
jgi:hypothetical protein